MGHGSHQRSKQEGEGLRGHKERGGGIREGDIIKGRGGRFSRSSSDPVEEEEGDQRDEGEEDLLGGGGSEKRRDSVLAIESSNSDLGVVIEGGGLSDGQRHPHSSRGEFGKRVPFGSISRGYIDIRHIDSIRSVSISIVSFFGEGQESSVFLSGTGRHAHHSLFRESRTFLFRLSSSYHSSRDHGKTEGDSRVGKVIFNIFPLDRHFERRRSKSVSHRAVSSFDGLRSDLYSDDDVTPSGGEPGRTSGGGDGVNFIGSSVDGLVGDSEMSPPVDSLEKRESSNGGEVFFKSGLIESGSIFYDGIHGGVGLESADDSGSELTVFSF